MISKYPLKLARSLYLAISFIIGSFFLIFGAFSIALPWSTFLQNSFIQFILEQSLILSLFGLGFALIGLSMIIYTISKFRHRYIQVQIGKQAISLDRNVIHQYLETYWQKLFPTTAIPFDLNFNTRSIRITADLPFLPLAEQKALLEQIKEDFSDLFGNLLGYPHEVEFIAHFPASKET